MAATHTGMSTEAFSDLVDDWLARAKHPKYQKLYVNLVYQPMVELLGYLHANGFKTFIVSGGGVEFMRRFAERIYGIPPEQVIGSSGIVKFEIGADGKPVLAKIAEVEFVNDGPGKPVAINRFIGRRPIAAFGSSDGDLQMLQWVCSGVETRLCLYVNHTDGEREWAYDRISQVGKLDEGPDEAAVNGWTVVDMKADWKTVFIEHGTEKR
jgi:hypothetical protein